MKKYKLVILFVFLGMFFCCYSFNTDDWNNSTKTIEIPFVLKNDGIFVKGCERIVFDAVINNQTRGYFSFDTAAVFSAIPLRSLFSLHKIQINEPEPEKIYEINRIAIGGVKLNTRSFSIKIKEGHRSFANENLNGLLGLYIFAGYWCEISFSEQKILLHQQKPDYFTQSLSAKIISGIPAVPVVVDDREVFCFIDTGAPGTLYLPESVVEQKELDEYTAVVSTGRLWDNGIRNYHLAKTHGITVFDQTFTDAYVMTNSYTAGYSGNPEYNSIGLIGIKFLQNYDLLFDLTSLKQEDIYLGVLGLSKIWQRDMSPVYFKPVISQEDRKYGVDSPITPHDIPSLGILMATKLEDGAIRIEALEEGSIAQTVFGLKLGMVITRLNGKILADLLEELIPEDLTAPAFPDIPVLKLSNQNGSFMWWGLGPRELTALGFSDTVKEITVLENGIELTIKRE
jgi:hypothetical protein